MNDVGKLNQVQKNSNNVEIVNVDLFLGSHLSQRFSASVVSGAVSGRLLAVCIGTSMWKASTPDGRHLRDIPAIDRPSTGYTFSAAQWSKGTALIYQPDGKKYAIWILLDRDGSVQGWYVNFEKRYRTDDSVVIRDYELDLSIDLRRQITVKDAESFLEKTGRPGYWSLEEIAYIPEAYREIASAVEKAEWPFCPDPLQGIDYEQSVEQLGNYSPNYPVTPAIHDWSQCEEWSSSRIQSNEPV
ncbi:DUF402 domain-containing protein [Nocardia terpenica]|uniref:DUF402 domain-containing protein n=1 Tax=Nocardia terpenica TaxID=455432 RepID=UPI001893648E|nr:DUF402 domain-containing protein [Nocardia terpenica]MBF6064106.1 DUF402 domain-containing protein [Nocardia terpenica]MBF6106439.1 DUF402 domain-containing protein [Nocardia terpenica]MBF6113724.1 DUF402 domain-containing protein [Nocardia terpenica]MBF6120652.1 DUF402 domain-containing protein [Nocardia terpenica]